MFKKYRFLIFFCFLVMLTGVSLLSIDKSYEIIVNEQEESQEEQDSSEAATLNITLEFVNIYGMGSSGSSGATISGWVGLNNREGKTTHSVSFNNINTNKGGGAVRKKGPSGSFSCSQGVYKFER